jgi:uncharacterized protein (DUF362 family)
MIKSSELACKEETTRTMKPLSRRDVLRLLATTAGALTLNQILAACGLDETALSTTVPPTQASTEAPTATKTSSSPTPAPEEATEVDPTATVEEPQSTATATERAFPDLVVARNGEPETLVRRALAAMGGLEKFVPNGSDVIIKPNICVSFLTYEYAATTNPWVIGTLVKMAYEAGAGRVRVMDHTWRREMTDSYINSGIQKQVEEAGGEMEWMPKEKFIPTELPNGVDLKSLDLYDEILNTDVLINVPIAKNHQDARLTLGMKNLLGVMDDRLTMHTNMGQRIADLSSRVRPTLNVMDAVRMMMDNGPASGYLGDVKQMNTVIVSQDIVALDSYTATLFDMQPSDLDYVRAATAMGLGRSDLKSLKIEEFSVS